MKEEKGMSLRQIAKWTGLSFSNIVELLEANGHKVVISPNEKIDIKIVRGINKIYPFSGKHHNLTGDTIELSKKILFKEDTTKNNKKPFSALDVNELYEAVKKINPELEGIIKNIKEAFDEEKKEIERGKKEVEREKKEVKKIIQKLEQKEANKTGRFKRAGHLTDQMLRYDYPYKKQVSLLAQLARPTEMEYKSGVQYSQIIEGIRLSPSETKIVDCLCKLLHENSQTIEVNDENYYTGNLPLEYVTYSDEITPSPKLAFTLYELTKEYVGSDKKVGGKDIENVKQVLKELDTKRFLLSYTETTKRKDGSRVETKIEDLKKLIHIVKISQTEYSKENVELSKNEETIIMLNPIFRRQINSKFVFYPDDINKRTIAAYGSPNVSGVTLRLRDYLLKEHALKHFNPEIKLQRLYYLLAEKWMKEQRKKKVQEYTEKAIEVMITLGILESFSIEESKSTGEPKIVFKLNKEWQ